MLQQWRGCKLRPLQSNTHIGFRGDYGISVRRDKSGFRISCSVTVPPVTWEGSIPRLCQRTRMMASSSRRCAPLLSSATRGAHTAATGNSGRLRILSERHPAGSSLQQCQTRLRLSSSGMRARRQCSSRTGQTGSAGTTARKASTKTTTEATKEAVSSSFSVYLARYTALLEARPLATKAITSGVIAFAGDITCQKFATEMARRDFEKAQEDDVKEGQAIATIGDGSSRAEFVPDDMDWGRCARFTLIGTVLVGPALHTWYGFLIRKFPDTALGTVVKRVTLDQLAFAPVFLATFLSSIMVLDGNAAKISSKLRADYTTTVIGNWGYWIPAQIVNFRFVPPVYQVLAANGFGFFWNIYLSHQSNKGLEKEPSPEDSE